MLVSAISYSHLYFQILAEKEENHGLRWSFTFFACKVVIALFGSVLLLTPLTDEKNFLLTMRFIALATATLLGLSLVAASVMTGENITSAASLGIDWGADIFNLPPEGSYFSMETRTFYFF